MTLPIYTLEHVRLRSEQLAIIVDDINVIRIQLSLTHTEIAKILQIHQTTYNNHRRNGYKSLSFEQIQMIYDFFSETRFNRQRNRRVRGNLRNRSIIDLT